MAHLDETLLQRYLDDELDADERAHVDALLAQDPAGQRRLQDYRDLGRGLALALDARVNSIPRRALWDALDAALVTQPARPPSLAQRLRAWFAIPRLELGLSGAALAAAVAIVVWVRATPLPERTVVQTAAALPADNTLIVESYEVTEGTVVIDVPEDSTDAPAVVWHFVDGDGADPEQETRG